eukprot:s35_g36.t1
MKGGPKLTLLQCCALAKEEGWHAYSVHQLAVLPLTNSMASLTRPNLIITRHNQKLQGVAHATTIFILKPPSIPQVSSIPLFPRALISGSSSK